MQILSHGWDAGPTADSRASNFKTDPLTERLFEQSGAIGEVCSHSYLQKDLGRHQESHTERRERCDQFAAAGIFDRELT